MTCQLPLHLESQDGLQTSRFKPTDSELSAPFDYELQAIDALREGVDEPRFGSSGFERPPEFDFPAVIENRDPS